MLLLVCMLLFAYVFVVAIVLLFAYLMPIAAYSRISDVDTGTFKYFIKVVPTEYQGWSGGSTSCFADDAHCRMRESVLYFAASACDSCAFYAAVVCHSVCSMNLHLYLRIITLG